MRPPVLRRDEIERGLQTQRLGRPLHVHDRVKSTNDVARELAEAGAPEGTAVLAREQTGGRGRMGRRWASPPGGLWLSVVLRPQLSVAEWTRLGFAASVAAAAAVEEVAGVPVGLKWPNDLVVGGRKLGGVLVEAGGAYAIAGIGINTNVQVELLEPEIAAAATSLSAMGRNVDLAALVRRVLLELEHHYGMLQRDGPAVMAKWRERSITLGRAVRVIGADVFDGIAETVDDDGALLVRTPSGVRRVFAGEVSLREVEAPRV